MLATIQNGIRAQSAEERSAALESLVAILESRGHELDADGLDEFADVLTQLLRALPPPYADRSAIRLTHALVAQSAARHPDPGRPAEKAGEDFSPAPPAHHDLLAIAGQPHVDAMETHRIVSRGNDEARRAVVRNPGAIFARSTLSTLAELAISDLSLKEALVARHDLPEAIGSRLWPFLSERAKVTLLTARRSETLAGFQSLVVEECDGDQALPATMAGQIRAGETCLAQTIASLTNDGRLLTAGLVLAACAGIAGHTGVHAVLTPPERPLVILLKALQADAATLADVIRLRTRCGIGASKDSRFAAILMDGIAEHEAVALTQAMDARMAEIYCHGT